MKRASTVIGIDVGYANLACCSLDANWSSPIRWTNERILEGKYTEEKLWSVTYQWCRENREFLGEASMIVLERQIEAPFKMMNTVIRTLYPNTAVVISPKTISAKYGRSHTRKEKKQEAVELVSKNVMLPRAKKKDDLADSYLLALWGLQQLEVSTEGWKN
jgi:hypothetical protein